MAALLQVSSLCTYYIQKGMALQAVQEVSFAIDRGETLAIVGESGCGKSTLALSLFRLVPPPGHIVSGKILFDSRDLLTLPEKEMGKVRGKGIGLILQDSLSSLNPVMRVGAQIAEARRHHFSESRKEARRKTLEIIEHVKLANAEKTYTLYPHQFSGGQRQRIAIALALACQPQLLVADEPTTALDVSIQAQILTLLKSLQQEMQLALLLITHDLGVVAQMADRVAVMYAGKIVEHGPIRDIFTRPAHPYTASLLNATPQLKFDAPFEPAPLPEPLAGTVPDLQNLPSGCSFHPRCPVRLPECSQQEPTSLTLQNGHIVQCCNHLAK
ncbi:MAG: ABC transporter ATP-binding protein [bacterium]